MPTLFRIEDYPAVIQPFNEEEDSDIFWKPEYGDEALPSRRGFISDLVYYSRGVEAPTLFMIWGALFALSTAIKREAWIKWFPEPLFSNFYTLLVGPAGIVKKGATIGVVKEILRGYQAHIGNINISKMKTVELICDKLTPEAMLNSMVPENKSTEAFFFVNEEGKFLVGPNGKGIRYEPTSECGIVISEASVSLGKQKYSEHIIQLLLDIYDCHKVWEWRTIARGSQYLRNLHTTMLAGTTMTGFREAIPQAAAADGFLSRSVIVHQPFTDRCFPFPTPTKDGPTMEDLQKRFAWIVEHTLGEFELTPEAYALYDTWYRQFHREIRLDPMNAGMRSRLPQQILKVAFLIRAQRYDQRDKRIHDFDIKDAIRILELTSRDVSSVVVQITGDAFLRNKDTVEHHIQEKESVNRASLLSGTRIKSEELNQILSHLVQERKIRIMKDGEEMARVGSNGGEVYEWIETKRGAGKAVSNPRQHGYRKGKKNP